MQIRNDYKNKVYSKAKNTEKKYYKEKCSGGNQSAWRKTTMTKHYITKLVDLVLDAN